MMNILSKFDHDAIRIVRVDHWLVRMPLAETILWGSGKRSGTTRLICRIQTRDGGIGWGETISLIDNVPAVFANIVAPLAAGYSIADAERFHRHVLGAGYVSMQTDVPLVEAVKKVVGNCDVRADVNGAWTPGTARRQLAKLAPYDLAYVEQPLELDDLAGHAELRTCQTVPIALDESAYSLSDVGNIVRASAADVVLLDPHEAGGVWQVIKQAAICESVGIPVTLHSGGELALSQAAYVHLAASIPNMSLAIDTEQTYLADDIAPDGPRLKNGRFTVPDRPGLGVEPDMALIERYVVDGIKGAYLDPDKPDWFPTKPAY